MKVSIKKGVNKGLFAHVTEEKTELGTKLFKLKDRSGNQIYNGSFTWFSESFLNLNVTF